jgi:hypothetical protein
MTLIDPESTRELLEALITASSVLGGGMAYVSGFYASQALVQGQPPEVLAQRINEGLAIGFLGVSPISALALIIAVWSR